MEFPPPYIGKSKDVNVIVETPRHGGNKYVFDQATSLFKLKKILPLGMVFPFHFGFIPGTQAEDGDPLDALVLMDEPAYPGCLIECRVIGTIEAQQTSKGKTVRNDRVITAAKESSRYSEIFSFSDLDKKMLKELAGFFKNYNQLEGKIFKIIGYAKKNKSYALIKRSMYHG